MAENNKRNRNGANDENAANMTEDTGQVLGTAGGGALGAVAGSVFGPVGTIAGAIAGGALGNQMGQGTEDMDNGNEENE